MGFPYARITAAPSRETAMADPSPPGKWLEPFLGCFPQVGDCWGSVRVLGWAVILGGCACVLGSLCGVCKGLCEQGGRSGTSRVEVSCVQTSCAFGWLLLGIPVRPGPR